MDLKSLLGISVIGLCAYAITKREHHTLHGGVGDNTRPEDVDPEELEMGVDVEHEHTDDDDIAEEIALDHLTEDPEYYTHLKEMEEKYRKSNPNFDDQDSQECIECGQEECECEEDEEGEG